MKQNVESTLNGENIEVMVDGRIVLGHITHLGKARFCSVHYEYQGEEYRFSVRTTTLEAVKAKKGVVYA